MKYTEQTTWTYFIVDDHPLLRQGLQFTLSKSESFRHVGEAGTIPEALKHIQNLNPDFLILDHDLENKGTGLELLQGLTNFKGHIALVTQCEDPAILKAYRDHGIKVMIAKINASEYLLQAFQALSQGQAFISTTIQELLSLPDPVTVLTPREIEVVGYIAQGKTNKEVASILNCSDETIKAHKANIMRKLNIGSSVEIGVWALRNGLIAK